MFGQFLFENIHFAIYTVTGLILFSIFWLYFDVYTGRKAKYDLLKLVGYFLLAVSFFIQATQIDTPVFALSNLSDKLNLIFNICRFIGLLSLFVGLLCEPLQKKPNLNENNQPTTVHTIFALSSVTTVLLPILSPVLLLLISLLYARRASFGLERHLKAAAIGFFLFFLSDLSRILPIIIKTNNPNLFNLLLPFGPIWILQHLFIIIGTIIMAIWVFSYLLRRIQSQVVIIFELTILILFLLVTISFTSVLLFNFQNQQTHELETTAKLSQKIIESKNDQLLSFAKFVSVDQKVIQAVSQKDNKLLSSEITNLYQPQKLSQLIVVDTNGIILARGEDPTAVGLSLSDDTLVKKALQGEDTFSIQQTSLGVVPTVLNQAATAIKSGDKIIGAVIASHSLDQELVNEIQIATSDDVSIYSHDTVSATTILFPDQKTHAIGIKENNSQVLAQVLKMGQNLTLTQEILNRSYIATYIPLKDLDNTPQAMLFIATPQSALLQTVASSVETTFLATGILLLLSLIPAYLIARHFSSQLQR